MSFRKWGGPSPRHCERRSRDAIQEKWFHTKPRRRKEVTKKRAVPSCLIFSPSCLRVKKDPHPTLFRERERALSFHLGQHEGVGLGDLVQPLPATRLAAVAGAHVDLQQQQIVV